MFGSFLKGVIKVATLPIDVLEAGADVCTGGDGSKASRQETPLGMASSIRDGVADAVEESLDD